MIAYIVAKIFSIIELLLLVYVLLSWFPQIKWQKQPFYALKTLADLFFAPFRRLIPPIGMIDISPIFAFICISIVANFLIKFLVRLGL